MEADLFNLVPAVGELNADRSNFEFGEIPGEVRAYGRCDFEVDRNHKVAEPAEDRRGDIARAYLHMYVAYPGGLSLKAEDLERFKAWDQADPPTSWENTWHHRVRHSLARKGLD